MEHEERQGIKTHMPKDCMYLFILINACSIFFQLLPVIFTMAAPNLVKITHSPYRFAVLKFSSKVQSARELALSTKMQTAVSGNEALKSSRNKNTPKSKTQI